MTIHPFNSKHPWLASSILVLGLISGCSVHDEPSVADVTTDVAEDDTGMDEDARADFAAASPELRQLAIETGLGLRAAQAAVVLFQAELDSQASGDSCPSRTVAGNTVSINATNCRFDGAEYDGEIVARNAITLHDLIDAPTFDPSKSMSLGFDRFRVSRAGERRTIDGIVEQSSPNAPAHTSRSTLSMGGDMPQVREDLSLSCVTDGAAQTCDVTAGMAEIEGLGSFEIRGTVTTGSTRYRGWLEFEGEQTLTLDLDTMDDMGCHPYAIDGVPAGDICVSTDGPPPIEVELGYAAGCVDGQLMLEGYVDVAVDAMTLELLGPRMASGLTTSLANPRRSTLDGWVWTAIADVSAVDWTCDDLPDTSYRVIAELDGQRACMVWGPDGGAFPANCQGG